MPKTKIVLKNIVSKLNPRRLPLHILSPGALVLVYVVIVGLAVQAQSIPGHQTTRPQAAAHKSAKSHAAAPSKAAPAPTPAPAPAPKPAPVRTTRAAGTPKPEPVVTPSPGSSVSGLTPTNPTPTPSGTQTTTGYLSLNWSGYLAANGTFTAVSGSWTATMATGNGSTTTADSTWIGIGGVTTDDLIQVGTQNIIYANGRVSTSAFYELLPGFAQTVPGVTVRPGDSMTASIVEVGSGRWTISITDNTNGQSWTATVSYNSSLSSAEWIEEDPSYASGGLIPFDNFNGAAFTGGLTTMNGRSVNIAASTAQPVTMVNGNYQPIAVPSAIGSDGASFTVSP